MATHKITIIQGYVRKTDATTQAALRNFVSNPNLDFLTMYYHPNGVETRKALHFVDHQGVVYQSLSDGDNSTNNLVQCLFFADANCYYTDNVTEELAETIFEEADEINFREDAIKSTRSQEAHHKATRFKAPL